MAPGVRLPDPMPAKNAWLDPLYSTPVARRRIVEHLRALAFSHRLSGAAASGSEDHNGATRPKPAEPRLGARQEAAARSQPCAPQRRFGEDAAEMAAGEGAPSRRRLPASRRRHGSRPGTSRGADRRSSYRLATWSRRRSRSGVRRACEPITMKKTPTAFSPSSGTLTRERVEEMRREARARFDARAGKPFSRRTLALEKRMRAKLPPEKR